MTPQTDRFRKKLFFVVIVCSIIPSALIHSQTQNYFGIDQTSLKIKKLRLLDMDLDGDADLIFLNLDKQRIECQENLGEGLFSPLITLARLNGTYHNAEFGNFIGGPAPDILLHGPNAEITVLEGSGSFSVMAHPQTVQFSFIPDYLNYQPADLDQDGYDDFAWIEDTSVIIWKGAPSGFTQLTIYTTPASWGAANAGGFIHYADFNNDGLVDLVCPNGVSFNQVVVLLNEGQMNFSPVVSSGPQLGSSKVPPADINGDGNLDLFYYPSLDVCFVAPGDGQGGFNAPYQLATGLRYLTIGDLDNDGLNDYISSQPIAPVCTGSTSVCNHQVTAMRNNGNGTFSSMFSHIIFNATSQLKLLECTGDGRLDILFVGERIGTNLYPSTPTGFQSPHVLVGSLVHDVRSLSFADMDGDNQEDIILTDFGTMNPNYARILGGISWMRNLGEAKLSHEFHLTPASINSSSISTVADFDQDGVMDIFYRTSDFRIRHGKFLSNTLTEEPLLNPGSLESGSYIKALDIAGDSTLEIYAGVGQFCLSNGGYYKYNGSEWYKTVVGNTSHATLYTTHDIDNDGKDNLVFFRTSSNSFVFLPHQGESTAAPVTIRGGLPGTPSAMTVSDFDQDGDPDLIYVYNNITYWIQNTGSFPFNAPQEAPLFGSIPTFTALLLDDLNADLQTDLVVFTESQLIIRLNQGDGTSTNESFERGIISGQTGFTLYTGNISGSGFKDIFIVSNAPGVIEQFFYPNYLSNCQNPSACNYSPGISPFGEFCILPAPMDLNCSGDQDAGDLMYFLSQFGCIETCPESDFNEDGIVNVQDLMFLIESLNLN
ncbi:MAG: FG-GAP repeat domain-containing protein [Flavobacteriales bacterium]